MMRWPGVIGTLAVHGAVAGLAWWFLQHPPERVLPVIGSVPVSIISETVVNAGPADNPIPDEVAAPEAAEVAPPEPTPPTPTPPTPRPTPPTPQPSPNGQRPPQKTQPPRTPPTPPQQQPQRELNLRDLRNRQPNNQPPSNRPPAGDRGTGQASLSQGQITDIAGQISGNWIFNCELPGARDMVVRVRLVIGRNGRLTSEPNFVNRRSGETWNNAIGTMERAIRASEPFRVPAGFEGQTLNLDFNAAAVCRNR